MRGRKRGNAPGSSRGAAQSQEESPRQLMLLHPFVESIHGLLLKRHREVQVCLKWDSFGSKNPEIPVKIR
jgi:hypothetical protein